MRQLSIEEAKDLIRRMEDRSTSPGGYYKSSKALVTMCNSLSVILFQYNMPEETAFFLETSRSTDKWFEKQRNPLHKAWEGRLLTYILLGFFHHKAHRTQDGLKELYKAQHLSILIKEAVGTVNQDLILLINMLTFVGLWKIKEFQEAKKYLNTSKDILKSLCFNNIKSRLSYKSLRNINGLLSLSSAGLALVVNNDKAKAQKICQKLIDQLEGELMIRQLIQHFLKTITPLKDYSRTVFDWLVTPEYEKFLVLSLLVPFIDPTTPVLQITDNRDTQSKASFHSTKTVPITEMVHKPKLKVVKKTDDQSIKHWWENSRFVENMFKEDLFKKGTPEPWKSRNESRSRRIRPPTTGHTNRIIDNRGQFLSPVVADAPRTFSRKTRRGSIDHQSEEPGLRQKKELLIKNLLHTTQKRNNGKRKIIL